MMKKWIAGRECTCIFVSNFIGLIVLGLSIRALAQSPIRADLERLADESTLEITTIGRKSGKPRTKPIWFVYEQGRLYLQSGKDGKTDWYQNLKKNPQMTLKITSLTLEGTAQFISDPSETERIHGLFRAKYLTARLAGLVGSSIGHGKAIEVKLQMDAPHPSSSTH